MLVPEMELEDRIAAPDRGSVRKSKTGRRFADRDAQQAFIVCRELLDVLALAQQGIDAPHHQRQVEACHLRPPNLDEITIQPLLRTQIGMVPKNLGARRKPAPQRSPVAIPWAWFAPFGTVAAEFS